MKKTILQYQKIFNNVVKRLNSNKNVLAVMVFGSMVSGDLWEESDIDLFVIVDEKLDEIKNIYNIEKSIPVHIKLLSKNKLFYHNHNIQDGFLHRVFAGSRLVFSKDKDITSKYDNDRYYSDIDRARWNLVYLGNFIKILGVCKKYIRNGSVYTTYASTMECAEEYSKLFINSSGYMINNNAINMAVNTNDEFKVYVDAFFFKNENSEVALKNIIHYMDKYVDENIKVLASFLIKFMGSKDCMLSSEDIKKDGAFKNFDINFQDILGKLLQLDIIKRGSRDYKTNDGTVLTKENVYYL
ncbi:nucleotidyltransferase domain-containing protein [Clostridium akagii]|uniref:nucleotidyltransferase domain-containing protein n=1 Tax=Clostridium akagii TaxID=91623 RepID=UPI00047D4979|nr:nucleotidyltransferase domain-containing protein [Clostridium akagii]